MGKRPRIFNSPAERAKRIKANFDFYDGIKKAISDHDALDNDFEKALAKDKLVKACEESNRMNAESDKL